MSLDELITYLVAIIVIGIVGLQLVAQLSPDPAVGTAIDLIGLQCRAEIAPLFFIPCNEIEPSVYPEAWWAMGREV